MAFEIVWTARAEKGFEEIITYIEENWSEQLARKFVRETFHFFELLSNHPEILEKSSKQKKNVPRSD